MNKNKVFFYISFCPLRILYNSKFTIMVTSLGTNFVVVTRVHCLLGEDVVAAGSTDE